MRDTQLPADFTVTVPSSMQLMDYLRIGKVYPVSESGTPVFHHTRAYPEDFCPHQQRFVI